DLLQLSRHRLEDPGEAGRGARMTPRMRRHARLGLVSILFATLTFFPTMAGGKGRAGIAPDLADALQQGSPSNRIRLILSLKGADPAYVASRVEKLGGVVRGYFPHVDHMLVVLPLESVTTLSEVEGVDYLSPDRAVKGVASHLEVATGASLV